MVFAFRRHAGAPAGVCLHIAPEARLRDIIGADGRRVVTTDLVRTTVDFRSDIQALPLRDGSVSLVVCSDVLEHVEDDGRALRELCRVISDDAAALLHVPIISRTTVEYGFADPMQHHHRRTYGPDVLDRIVSSGLVAEPFLADSFDLRDRRRYGLSSSDVIFLASRAETPTV